MTDEARAATLAHLRLVASFPGFWELRALRRLDGNRMESRGSFFIIATSTADSLLYDRLEHAVDWADHHAKDGAEIFVGMNPREREAGGKDAVASLTATYVDLDLPEGVTIDDAVAELTAEDGPLPSLIVGSGYGLHVSYLLRAPEASKATWKTVQRGLVRKWADLGADRKVAPDESRVLRLVPYPNRKRWPDGVPTSILYSSDARYSLDELVGHFPGTGPTFSRAEVIDFPLQPVGLRSGDDTVPLPVTEDLEPLVERAQRHRLVFETWLRQNMKPGLHYGIIPIDGQEASKPTLLKPGAELVAFLYGWRLLFTADLDSLQMNGPAIPGVFAYVCHAIDREGRTVGQGRGVAELREIGMNNANKCVKLAEKRAMVDTILRCASLSEWFTQDLEETQFIAPEAATSGTPRSESTETRRPANRCTPAQIKDIRMLLKMSRRHESEIVQHYKLDRLENLSTSMAMRLIERLETIAYGRT